MSRANTFRASSSIIVVVSFLLAGCAGEPAFTVPRSLNLTAVAPTAADLESIWLGGWNVSHSGPFDVSSDEAANYGTDLPEACRDAGVSDAYGESSFLEVTYHNGGGSNGFGGNIQIHRVRDQVAATTIYNHVAQFDILMNCQNELGGTSGFEFECSSPSTSQVVEAATVQFCENMYEGPQHLYERSVVRAVVRFGNTVIISHVPQQDTVDIELALRQDIAERVLQITLNKLRSVVTDG